jgi:hypothetical protein
MAGSSSNFTVDFTDNAEDNSTLFDPRVTYSFDKYSCMVEFYFIHIVFNYLIFLSGIACLVTRVWTRFISWHKWSGRIYILSMLWSTCSSLLINNTGLPLATLISFGAVMGGLTVGWIAILMYKIGVEQKVLGETQKRLTSKSKDEAEINLQQLMDESKTHVLRSMTWKERFISLKTVHGTMFFISWFQITGRIFASDQSGNFDCYTYPVYKPIPTTEGDFTDTVTFVPTHDPNWDELPWSKNGPVAWCMSLIFGSMAFALLVGAIWTYFDVRYVQKQQEKEMDADNHKEEEVESEGMDRGDQPSSAQEISSDENSGKENGEVVDPPTTPAEE